MVKHERRLRIQRANTGHVILKRNKCLQQIGLNRTIIVIVVRVLEHVCRDFHDLENGCTEVQALLYFQGRHGHYLEEN